MRAAQLTQGLHSGFCLLQHAQAPWQSLHRFLPPELGATWLDLPFRVIAGFYFVAISNQRAHNYIGAPSTCTVHWAKTHTLDHAGFALMLGKSN